MPSNAHPAQIKSTVAHATFTIERNFAVPPQRVFAAFSDPSKKRAWFADKVSADIDSYELDFRVGGKETTRARFRAGTPFPVGTPLANDSVHHDIVPNERIVIAYTMSIGNQRISSSLATFEFLPAPNGTNLLFTEQAAFFEGGDGPEMRKGGWQGLFDHLSRELAR